MHKFGGLFARAITFCTMAPKVLSIISADFSYTQKCVSILMHRAESAIKQWGSQTTAWLEDLSMYLASSLPSCAYSLEVAPRFL